MTSPPNQQQSAALPAFPPNVQLPRRLRENDTATPTPFTNPPGGIIRQTAPSRSRNGFDPSAPRVNGTSESGEIAESPPNPAGSWSRVQPRPPPPPPAATLLSPHSVARVLSDNNLAAINAGAGRCLPPTPLELQAKKSRDTLRGSDNETVRAAAGTRIPRSAVL
jgi:hypothetical protein